MSNLTDLQRIAAWKKLGEDCRRLLAEGYAVEADKVLDEMIARRDAWEKEACHDPSDKRTKGLL